MSNKEILSEEKLKNVKGGSSGAGSFNNNDTCH